MRNYRQMWRELDSRNFYTRLDFLLDVGTAVLMSVALFVLIAHGLGVLFI